MDGATVLLTQPVLHVGQVVPSFDVSWLDVDIEGCDIDVAHRRGRTMPSIIRDTVGEQAARQVASGSLQAPPADAFTLESAFASIRHSFPGVTHDLWDEPVLRQKRIKNAAKSRKKHQQRKWGRQGDGDADGDVAMEEKTGGPSRRSLQMTTHSLFRQRPRLPDDNALTAVDVTPRVTRLEVGLADPQPVIPPAEDKAEGEAESATAQPGDDGHLPVTHDPGATVAAAAAAAAAATASTATGQPSASPSSAPQSPGTAAASDVIVRLRFYHPRDPARVHDMEVLGSQPLDAVAGALRCASDEAQLLGEPGECRRTLFVEGVLFVQPDELARDQDPSKERERLARSRAGAELTRWANSCVSAEKSGAMSWGFVARADMTTVTWSQLRLRPGAHYLYTHAGDCEHVVVVMGVRSRTAYDEGDMSMYPRSVHRTAPDMTLCQRCHSRGAVHLVVPPCAYQEQAATAQAPAADGPDSAAAAAAAASATSAAAGSKRGRKGKGKGKGKADTEVRAQGVPTGRDGAPIPPTDPVACCESCRGVVEQAARAAAPGATAGTDASGVAVIKFVNEHW